MDTFSAADHQYMALAIQLAAKGLYSTHPNPRVGCVIVSDHTIIGSGFHQKAGEAHAEILALDQAGEDARGATVYVTLEPCSHHGKTPPCADALIAAGVAEVVVAMQDPNPLVAGQGMKRLEQAGIKTRAGLMSAEAHQLNPGFIKRMEQGLPWVRVKLAMSLDGRTAMASGESQWITGSEARLDVQRLRARSEAILTGIGTVQKDDPSLNVRLDAEEIGSEGELVQPLRVVADPWLEMPVDARMLRLEGNTLLVYSEDADERREALESAGATTIRVAGTGNQLELKVLLKELADREISEVHVEAGAVLAGALLDAGFVDELVIYMASHIMGSSARGLFDLPRLAAMKDRIDFTIADIRAVGKDWRITAYPDKQE
jgi:diaminohydroxyphosphoribosylaminopyrimidine deaminase/5-amino-6-(5-phosphoribosylamino)uracil reductase